MDSEQILDAQRAMNDAAVNAGSWAALARICGCTPANLSQLKSRGSLLTPRFVLPVEDATGVSRHRLRPDLYPLSEVPAERTVGTGAPIVSCDRGAGMQPVRGA